MKAIGHLLSEMFRLHHRELVRFATRLVGDRDDGEEIAQDAYMSIAGRGTQAGAIGHPKSYLFTAARNAAIDFTARRKIEWSYRVDVDGIEDLASDNDPLAALEQRQQLARLIVALNELPPACRRAFILNKIEGRGHQEIARLLGISVSMVEKHIMRALRQARDLRREDGPFKGRD
jgi:RNA polymerase sigma-70 factor (ECF subfamily)